MTGHHYVDFVSREHVFEGQHLIAVGDEIGFAERIEARMGDLERRRDVLGQPFVADPGAIVDAGTFDVKTLALDTVEVQDRRMRSKT